MTLANERKTKLSPAQAAEIERQLSRYTKTEADKLGLGQAQWVEPVHDAFPRSERTHTTILISGLTLAHDELCCAALRGLGFVVETLDCPDRVALQFGKEFGNRGQCNPTYFTVGNLIKHLAYLRDKKGLSLTKIVDNYVFLTAGACGPCRFGTYVTEYRKALRDAGFDGFRVMLFQQQGGIRRATGDDSAIAADWKFASALVRGMIAGDVLNLLGYRLRPYETVKGATDTALGECRRELATALEHNRSVVRALLRCRKILRKLRIDRSTPRPLVSVIGEFWAMTTEGDGNYQLQRFLEQEGAEVDIQGISNWLLFMLWENRHDTRQRLTLRRADTGRKGLKGKRPGRKLMRLALGEVLVRGTFQLYANILGLHRYNLPDMDHIAALAADHYDNNVRGGEGHMEVGKLIHFVEDRVNHMTISVKPFGCMPSSGVSDGVQSIVTARYPDAIFLPIETTGDGEANVQSRIQMMLYRARQAAGAEYEQALSETGLDERSFQERLLRSRRWQNPFARPSHRTAGITTNLVYALGKASPGKRLESDRRATKYSGAG